MMILILRQLILKLILILKTNISKYPLIKETILDLFFSSLYINFYYLKSQSKISGRKKLLGDISGVKLEISRAEWYK